MDFQTFAVQVPVLLLLIFGAFADREKSPEQTILETILQDADYNRIVRPVRSGNASAPVLVDVNLFLRNVGKLDDTNKEFSVQLTFRQKWKDERLSYSAQEGLEYVTLVNPENKIWRPDTFFSNEKHGKIHDLMVQNEFVRIYPGGEIMQSARISLTLTCAMNLRYFPLDKQTCLISLASYGYTSSNVAYSWEKDNPVQLSDNLSVDKFILKGLVTSYCDTVTKTGKYSCLRVELEFKRLFSPYLIHFYIPCTMFVIVSWLSFWITAQAVTGRVVLSTLTLFVLVAQTLEINKTFPPTSYTKAADWWTGICNTFVFATLVEFIIVHYIAHREQLRRSTIGIINKTTTSGEGNDRSGDEEQEIPLKEITQMEDAQGQGQSSSGKGTMKITQRAETLVRNYVSNYESLPDKVDAICRIVFPVLFLIFNIIYWSMSSS